MSKGALLFAFNSPKYNYFEMAIATAKRINHFLDLPVTIVTDINSMPIKQLYKFDNVAECIQSLQSIKRDEWATEANIALDYHIAILDELEEISDVRNLQQN